MTLGDLLRETLDVDCDEVWENERTPTLVRIFGVEFPFDGIIASRSRSCVRGARRGSVSSSNLELDTYTIDFTMVPTRLMPSFPVPVLVTFDNDCTLRLSEPNARDTASTDKLSA